MAKKPEENKEHKLCMEHREKLHMTGDPMELMDVECDNLRLCINGCPLPENQRANPPKKKKDRLVKAPDGTNLPIIAPTKVADFMENLGKEVYGKPEAKEKPKKQKEIGREVEDFLWMQSSVISKLAWHPEIWKALYKLNADEILDRLLGKTGLETVPTMAGGKMQFEASTQTKKMFADLENKFAEEDEKKGKPEPKGDWGGLGDCVDEPHGYFEKGVWKNGKKNKNTTQKT